MLRNIYQCLTWNKKMKSITFKKWKEQGLNVNVMLYNDELLMSRALTEKEMNKQESTISSIDRLFVKEKFSILFLSMITFLMMLILKQ